MTTVEIAKLMGISRQRVSQIERRALAKLKRNPRTRRLLDELNRDSRDHTRGARGFL